MTPTICKLKPKMEQAIAGTQLPKLKDEKLKNGNGLNLLLKPSLIWSMCLSQKKLIVTNGSKWRVARLGSTKPDTKELGCK